MLVVATVLLWPLALLLSEVVALLLTVTVAIGAAVMLIAMFVMIFYYCMLMSSRTLPRVSWLSRWHHR
jgi:hypothetical protein